MSWAAAASVAQERQLVDRRGPARLRAAAHLALHVSITTDPRAPPPPPPSSYLVLAAQELQREAARVPGRRGAGAVHPHAPARHHRHRGPRCCPSRVGVASDTMNWLRSSCHLGQDPLTGMGRNHARYRPIQIKQSAFAFQFPMCPPDGNSNRPTPTKKCHGGEITNCNQTSPKIPF